MDEAQTGKRRWWVLAALALGSLIVNIDTTVLNLALPTLSNALHASTAQLQWFVAAYTLAMAGLMLPAGLLGDRLGRRRLMVTALALFGVASVACAVAVSPTMFIVARVIAGLGAAFYVPLAMAMLNVLFTDEERPKAITILMGMSMAAAPIGPILGGWLLEHFWWGSVFLINVPVVAVALGVVRGLMPESRGTGSPHVDWPGIAGSSGGLALLVYGIIAAGQNGWGNTSAIVTLVCGAAALAAFVWWELRVLRKGQGQPLVDPRLFRSPGFTWGTLLAMIMTFALFGISFIGPQFFQAVKGVDPEGTGLRLLAMVGGLLVGSVLGNGLLVRLGAKLSTAAGFALLGAGLLVGSLTHVASGTGFVLGWMAVVGAGTGFVLPATMAVALAALPTEHSGVGSSVIMAVRMVGGAFGVAILGSILNGLYQEHLVVAGLSAQTAVAAQKSVFGGIAVAEEARSSPLLEQVQGAFTSGMDTVLIMCGAIALVGVLLAVLFMPRHPEGTQETTSGSGERNTLFPDEIEEAT